MPRRKIDSAEAGREAILRGAGVAFSEKGYRGTTMQDIAAAAGYTAPTLYAYFNGKEDILRSLIDDLVAELMAAFEEPSPKGTSFEKRLEQLLRRHQTVAEAHRDALVFLMRLGPDAVDDEREKKTYQQRMVRWMRDVQRDTGELQGVPAPIMALALTSLFEGFLNDWAQRGGRRSLSGLVKNVKTLFLSGVRGVK